MNKLLLPTAFCSLLGGALSLAPAQASYPSKVSEVLATYAPARSSESGFANMVGAAQRFVAALNDERRAECLFELDDAERGNWTNLPPRAEEGGVRLGDLNETQLERACDLLAAVLSDAGYEKVRDILLADDTLLRNGQARVGFGAENFWLVLFGKPDAEERWALQLDGHHLGLNLTFQAGDMCMTPSFIGTQPSAYERGDDTIRPMEGETRLAYALVAALTPEQRDEAVIGATRGRIELGPGRDGEEPTAKGLPCSLMNAEQRGHLLALVGAYVALLPDAHAAKRMQQLGEEVDRMHFAWSGPTSDQSDVSYSLMGPSLLIEFACQDLGGNPLNHLHAMVRNQKNEYGTALAAGD